MQELSFENAISVLQNDGIIIYPTETFYGIGCRISSDKAIASIFQIKKRLLALPLPTIVSDLEQVFSCTNLTPAMKNDVEELAGLYWGGPLTFILPAKKTVSALLTGGTETIALRQSSHPVATALARELGEPIVSSSANISGKAPSACFNDLESALLNHVGGYLNTPPMPQGGQPSTLIKIHGDKKITLLREGALSVRRLLEKGYSIK